MRVLCLHGMGVNAAIFQAQTAHFRSLLVDYEWVFVDGPAECEAAPGIAALYPPPYRCWYTTPTTAKVDSAQRLISSIIQREGPFDAIMGFSQGAAVAASAILRHQLENPSKPPLFRMAIFLCSPIPFSQSLDFGIDARRYFGLTGKLKPSRLDCPTTVPEYLITDPAYLKYENELDENSSDKNDPPNFHNPHEIYYQMYHASVDRIRINVPTANILGRQDQWRLHSKDLADLCAWDLTTVVEHDGGHEIPLSAGEEVCDAIEITASKIW